MGPFESLVEKKFSEQVGTPQFPRMLARYTAETEGIALAEAARRSLSRVFRIFTDPARNAAILTAFRGEYSFDENIARNRKLMADLRTAGYGFVPVLGGFVETTDDGDKREVDEESLVISGPVSVETAENLQELRDPIPSATAMSIGGFQRTMLMLCRKYDQDGVLLKLSGSTDVVLLEKSGSSMTLGPWRLNDAAKYYTKMRFGAQAGRKMEFTFECAGDGNAMTRRVVETYFKRKGQ